MTYAESGPVQLGQRDNRTELHDSAQDKPTGRFDHLLPHHLAQLRASGLSDATIRDRGYRSVTKKIEIADLGFTPSQRRVPALLIPVLDHRGAVASYQTRPDAARVGKNRKPISNETPRGTRLILDVPPAARDWLQRPGETLYITEGCKKADAAAQHGLCCVALLGVWNWRGTNEFGGKTALADWECIHLKDRQVRIAFDSDVSQKASVAWALTRLKNFLESRGARVRIVYLPPGRNGEKVGLDDFFVQGGSADHLEAMSTDRIAGMVASGTHPYLERDDGIYYERLAGDEMKQIRLTNFTAQIVTDIRESDGAEHRRRYEIEARVDGEVTRLTVPAESYDSLSWIAGGLGARAWFAPTFNARALTAHAIRELSESSRRQTVYAHSGWATMDGETVFLHASGAIGPAGSKSDVHVALPPALHPLSLPDHPDQDALTAGFRAVQCLIDDLDRKRRHRIVLPLFAGACTVVLTPTDFSLFLVGTTGVFKSEIAALIQQFFGAGFTASSLPGNWSSTDNAIEELLFLAKDVVCVVDDFVPGVDGNPRRSQNKADRILRGQGNRQGRARLNRDGTPRPARPPRGMVLATGEEPPQGESIRARSIIIPVGKGDISVEALSEAQTNAADGQLARVMAAFILWIAENNSSINGRLPGLRNQLRADAAAGTRHRRTPQAIADLGCGLQLFLDFAEERRLVSDEQAASLWSDWWAALQDVGASQQRLLRRADPSRRFLELVRDCLAAGSCHLASPSGGRPECSNSVGWATGGTHHGERIGYVDGEDVFLLNSVALRHAKRLAADTDEPLTATEGALRRQLHENGLLKSVELRGDEARHQVRKQLDGRRQSVLHVARSALFGVDEDA